MTNEVLPSPSSLEENKKEEKKETEEVFKEAKKERTSFLKGRNFKFFLVISISLAFSFLAILPVLALFLPLPVKEEKTVVISRGSSTDQIAEAIQNNGIPLNVYMFKLAAKAIANGYLQAGEYKIIPKQSLADIVIMMRDGKSVIRLLTIAEGLTSLEIVKLLRDNPALSGEITDIPEEGSLWPDTYRYIYGDKRTDIIKIMQEKMQEKLNSIWEKRDNDLPYKTPREALIMASIIEKETGKKAEERSRVAGVFVNRLKRNMPLQADPTVIYAISKGKSNIDRELTRDDLLISSPYNTYLNTGLPPGPISNPGLASLEAAVKPEKNDFLYFVADGTGGHVFSKELAVHNKNVKNWRKIQNDVKVKK